MARLKFYISTHASTGRPIITLSCDIFELKCLIDTGADTPALFDDIGNISGKMFEWLDKRLKKED